MNHNLEGIQPVKLEPIIHRFSNPFLRKVEEQFHQALAYEHKETLENAKRIIPSKTLANRVMQKNRTLQKALKKGSNIEQVAVEDLMIVELLNWFKGEFFEWVDCPVCEHCRNKTIFSHVVNDPSDQFAKRKEIYKCEICKKDTAFPRYNDVNILLETRKGRCGEWANAFTLICWASNLEARLVVDETDHVWTEVYSRCQKRWLHCDPCENVCDNPLMYEHGWKKKLSYVIAYSPNEIQDVTWRYTSNFKEVMRRRTKCNEGDLVAAIVQLRNERLKKFKSLKSDHIQQRTIIELADFLTERQPGDEMYEGRKSGALDWRIARGDISESPPTSYYFKLTFPQFTKLEYSMKYSCSSDRYTYGTDLHMNQWHQGTYQSVDMMRKEENDWNKVYLCRKEGTERGNIVWMFRLLDTYIKINKVYIKLESQTFENGKVEAAVIGNTEHEKGPVSLQLSEGNEIRTEAFRGCRCLRIEVTLSGGVGPTAWQHAQLFRQDLRGQAPQYPFEVFLTFDN